MHLVRTEENAEEIAALHGRLGDPCGLAGVLDDLHRQARPARVVGLAVSQAFSWDQRDNTDRRWWPQGISTSADASDDEVVLGRRVIATSWYAKAAPDDPGPGSRLTFVDADTLRYRHVLLVVPTGDGGVEPLRIHAGGILWRGDWMHVASTVRGIVSFRLDDIVATEEGPYTYVLPVRFAYLAVTSEGNAPLRYSFLSLDRSDPAHGLVAGEYGGKDKTWRLMRYAMGADGLLMEDEDGRSVPLDLHKRGVGQMQGAVTVNGRWYVSASRGMMPGTVHAGEPGAFTPHRLAMPVGPEDLTYWPSTDELWSLAEFPKHRSVFAMPRSRFD